MNTTDKKKITRLQTTYYYWNERTFRWHQVPPVGPIRMVPTATGDAWWSTQQAAQAQAEQALANMLQMMATWMTAYMPRAAAPPVTHQPTQASAAAAKREVARIHWSDQNYEGPIRTQPLAAQAHAAHNAALIS